MSRAGAARGRSAVGKPAAGAAKPARDKPAAADEPGSGAQAEAKGAASRAERLVREIAARHFGEKPRKVVAMGGGLTNAVHGFSVSKGSFIVRSNQDATKIHDYLKEQWAMDAARAAGVPTPCILEVGNFADGRPYMILEEVAGIEGTRAPRRLEILESLGCLAARLHTVRTRGFGPVFDWSSNQLSRHESWAGWLTAGFDVERRLAVLLKLRLIEPRQAARLRKLGVEIARWRKPPVLHHGDLRLKNAIVDATTGRIAAVLDWETCTSSPGPYWDLSLALHDLGVDEKEAFLAGYGIKPRAFEAALPLLRFFNLLNYARAAEAAAAGPKRERLAGLTRLRLRLQGGLDLYGV